VGRFKEMKGIVKESYPLVRLRKNWGGCNAKSPGGVIPRTMHYRKEKKNNVRGQ